MKNSIKKMTLAVFLTLISMAGATPAQKTIKSNLLIANIKSDLLLEYDGVETFAGTSDSINSILWGETFSMQSVSYSQTNCLNISINSSTERAIPIDGEGQSGDGVLGGNWSLTVFRENRVIGTTYGEVTGGVTHEAAGTTKDPTVRQTRITLRTTGGTGALEGIGKRHIIGTFEAATNLVGSKRLISGTLSINF